MKQHTRRWGLAAAILAVGLQPAAAHHLMGGRIPATFTEGILSGLGHPIIGLDHFAAVVAVGCLAATHRSSVALAIGFVLAMIAGVAAHLHGGTVPAGETLAAISVVGLGVLLFRHDGISAPAALALFVLVGLIHGYLFGESIYGAEPTPLYAYLLGLAAIQSAVALGAMAIAQALMRKSDRISVLRPIGTAIAGVGLTVLAQQIVPMPA
ncbi:MAG TPA: HupE/UreJ family protein [Pseudolabrys sp.]|jgi:urease accessory protein|nr:HupE/UreJ family protein [Pseudolabrys sp.]